jgi:chromosome partitioning protein
VLVSVAGPGRHFGGDCADGWFAKSSRTSIDGPGQPIGLNSAPVGHSQPRADQVPSENAALDRMIKAFAAVAKYFPSPLSLYRGQAMLVQTSQGQSGSAHVVVLGNEKGGSGKSTVALHVAVALLKAGQRVATIDLDCRQQSFTRYITNRSAWARRTGLDLELPVHRCIKLGETMRILDNEASELVQFVDAVSRVERAFDFIVIDTPGSDTYLMRLAHTMADTLVTPINESFLDFDVLGTVDPLTYSVTGESHYAEIVRDARRKRRQLDGASTDWIVVRNRLSKHEPRNKQLVVDGLNELSLRLGFRSIDGFTEREVYREFYPRGLTALDDLDGALGPRPSMEMAREEVTSLLRQLKLPIDERGRRRAANRAEWFNQVNKPLEVHDIFGAPQLGFQTGDRLAPRS